MGKSHMDHVPVPFQLHLTSPFIPAPALLEMYNTNLCSECMLPDICRDLPRFAVVLFRFFVLATVAFVCTTTTGVHLHVLRETHPKELRLVSILASAGSADY